MEGLLVGAIIGGQAGPIGAAAGAAIFLVYGAVTGEMPLGGGGGGGWGGPSGPEAQREAEIEDELERQASLEGEIEEELRRQEELLNEIDEEESSEVARTPTGAPPSEEEIAEKADPRAAPRAPQPRELPASIFQEKRATIQAGQWGDNKKTQVLARSLDADKDGRPEEIRYFEEKSGQLVRIENDRNFDGRIDGWTRYEGGVVVGRELDESGDGKPDAWEIYQGGAMVAREVDRDGDGTRDAFYVYASGSLIEERHDQNGDGEVDRRVYYESRRIARTEEDRDQDGRIDAWASYGSGPGGEEVVTRVERDTKKTGKPDTFETFAQQGGKTVLTKREEDVNGDGKVDVTSIYENGKLVKREIADPALTPL
jgi:hypothetical protein